MNPILLLIWFIPYQVISRFPSLNKIFIMDSNIRYNTNQFASLMQISRRWLIAEGDKTGLSLERVVGTSGRKVRRPRWPSGWVHVHQQQVGLIAQRVGLLVNENLVEERMQCRASSASDVWTTSLGCMVPWRQRRFGGRCGAAGGGSGGGRPRRRGWAASAAATSASERRPARYKRRARPRATDGSSSSGTSSAVQHSDSCRLNGSSSSEKAQNSSWKPVEPFMSGVSDSLTRPTVPYSVRRLKTKRRIYSATRLLTGNK